MGKMNGIGLATGRRLQFKAAIKFIAVDIEVLHFQITVIVDERHMLAAEQNDGAAAEHLAKAFIGIDESRLAVLANARGNIILFTAISKI